MATEILTTRSPEKDSNGTYSFSANLIGYYGAGGAVRFNGISQIIVLYDSTFTNCAAVFGGAVSQDNDKSTLGGTFTVQDTTFSGNVALQYGGALNIQGATTANIIRCTFTSNSTSGAENRTNCYGGAIFIHKASNVIINSCIFNGNATAGKADGGAIYCHLDGANGTLTIQDSQFLTATDTIYCNKKLSVFDGTCYFGAEIYSATKLEIKGNITVNSKISCANVTLDAGSKLTLGPNSTIAAGTALNCESGSNIEFDCASVNLNNISGTPKICFTEKVTTITGDQSKYDITRVNTSQHIVGSGTLVNLQSIISSGELGPITSRHFENYGAIVVGGTLSGNYTTQSPLNITSNTAVHGGGMLVNATGDATLKNVSFTANTVTTYGGAVYNNGVATLISGNYTSNTANFGGAIFNKASATIYDASFIGNIAMAEGGAIQNNSGATANITSISFSNNKAEKYGGAINNSGIVYINGCSFNANIASQGGAAILNKTNASAYVSNATFVSNNTMDYGGAINNAGAITVNSSIISNNSGGIGGGIYTKDAMTVTNTQLNNNSVTGFGGGGIYVDSNATVSCGNNTFTSNTGTRGGGILNKGTLTITSGAFTSDSVSKHGGAIYNSGNVHISGTTENKIIFSGNTALENGGALYNADMNSIINISNVSFASNSASSGAALFNSGGQVNIVNASFSGNVGNGTIINDINGLIVLGGGIQFVTPTDTLINNGILVFDTTKNVNVNNFNNIINNGTIKVKVANAHNKFERIILANNANSISKNDKFYLINENGTNEKSFSINSNEVVIDNARYKMTLQQNNLCLMCMDNDVGDAPTQAFDLTRRSFDM